MSGKIFKRRGLPGDLKAGIFLLMFVLAAFSAVSYANDAGIVAGKAYRTTTVLKVREKPDLKSKQVDTLQKGDSVFIIEVAGKPTKVGNKTAKWGRVEYMSPGKPSIKGYVYLGFLEEDSAVTGTDSEDPGVNPLWGCNDIRNFEYNAEAGFNKCTQQDFATLQKLAKKNPKASQREILDLYDKQACIDEFRTAVMNCGIDLNEKR